MPTTALMPTNDSDKARPKIHKELICGLAIFLLTLMSPSMGLASSGGEGIPIMVGGYQISLAFTEPAKAGKNLFHVQILDGKGMSVKGAQVEISAMPGETLQPHPENMAGMDSGTHGMERMDGMQGMNHAPMAVPAKAIEDEYVGVITFSAVGHWMLNARFNINGQMFNADFPVEVAKASSFFAISILAAFIGLNALIIWAASKTKRKPALSKPIGNPHDHAIS